jgi:hypothetical protein
VDLRGLSGVMHGVLMMPVSDVGMVGCFVCLARLVVLRSLSVVMSRALVMLGRLLMMLVVLHSNLRLDSFRVALKPDRSLHEAVMKAFTAAFQAA